MSRCRVPVDSIFFPEPAKQCGPSENDGYRGRLSIPRARKAHETRAALYYISRDGDDMLLACKERERLTDMLLIGRCRTISSRTPHVIDVEFYRSVRLPRSSAISPEFHELTARFPNDSSRAEAFAKKFHQYDTWRISTDREMHCFTDISLICFHGWLVTYSVLDLLTGSLLDLIRDGA